MALQEGNYESASDVVSWLKNNNLEALTTAFQTRDIALEELVEIVDLGDEELSTFAKEIAPNLSENLIQAAKRLRLNPVPDIAATHKYPTPSTHSQPHIIVSPAEHHAISTLYERYDETSNVCSEIQQYHGPLSSHTLAAIKAIEYLFDETLMPLIEQKKHELLQIIDQLMHKKEQQLQQQLVAIERYIAIVDKGKKQYDAYIDNTRLDMNQRKTLVVNMIDEIFKHPAAYNWFITAPEIKFGDFNTSLDTFYSKISIDDCDQPRAPNVNIVKVGFSSVKIQWSMDDIDIFGAKPVIEFEISYAALPKTFRKRIKLKYKKKKHKKKKKKKKRRKKTSKEAEDSETESDTESTSDLSDSDTTSEESESESAEETENEDNFDESMVEIDTLKWIENDKKIKVKSKDLKKKKRFKYTTEGLKDEWPYVIRVRGRNASGWGQYCKLLKVQTKKLVIDSKILNDKHKIRLMKMVPAGKKRRWKLCFRATKHGFTASQFHQHCDGKSPTVIVVQSTIGNIFGGYTSIAWSSSGSYKFDQAAFVYILKSKTNKHQKPMKWGVNPSNNNSVYHNSGYGATFGGGHDLCLCNNCNTTNSSYASLGSSYQAPKDKTLLAGSNKFMVTDYEVFHLVRK